MYARDRVLASETKFQAHSPFQFSKVLPKSAFFMNRVPRLRLKVNSIMRTEFHA